MVAVMGFFFGLGSSALIGGSSVLLNASANQPVDQPLPFIILAFGLACIGIGIRIAEKSLTNAINAAAADDTQQNNEKTDED